MNARLKELTAVISYPSPELLEQCLDLQGEFDPMSTKEAEDLLRRSRGFLFRFVHYVTLCNLG